MLSLLKETLAAYGPIPGRWLRGLLTHATQIKWEELILYPLFVYIQNMKLWGGRLSLSAFMRPTVVSEKILLNWLQNTSHFSLSSFKQPSKNYTRINNIPLLQDAPSSSSTQDLSVLGAKGIIQHSSQMLSETAEVADPASVVIPVNSVLQKESSVSHNLGGSCLEMSGGEWPGNLEGEGLEHCDYDIHQDYVSSQNSTPVGAPALPEDVSVTVDEFTAPEDSSSISGGHQSKVIINAAAETPLTPLELAGSMILSGQKPEESLTSPDIDSDMVDSDTLASGWEEIPMQKESTMQVVTKKRSSWW